MFTEVLEKGEWKPPGRHYDFLAKIDQEENLRKKRTERPSSIGVFLCIFASYCGFLGSGGGCSSGGFVASGSGDGKWRW